MKIQKFEHESIYENVLIGERRTRGKRVFKSCHCTHYVISSMLKQQLHCLSFDLGSKVPLRMFLA